MGVIRDWVSGFPRRSVLWPKVRKLHLLSESRCQACGGVRGLEVHHIIPFYIVPLLELAQGNLITLCEMGANCHFTFGHLRHWKSYNPFVRLDVGAYYSRVSTYRIFKS